MSTGHFTDLDLPENPKLTHNITHFARALRRAGLPIGPGAVIDAVRAVLNEAGHRGLVDKIEAGRVQMVCVRV